MMDWRNYLGQSPSAEEPAASWRDNPDEALRSAITSKPAMPDDPSLGVMMKAFLEAMEERIRARAIKENPGQYLPSKPEAASGSGPGNKQMPYVEQ